MTWNECESSYPRLSNEVNQGSCYHLHYSIDIDRLLCKSRKSVYMFKWGTLSYADDITISCHSIHSLNFILDKCNTCSYANCIAFNSKKTVCI